MIKKHVHIIPHIPKTAGSTLVSHLNQLDQSEYKFYHLAQRGRIGYHEIKSQFESDVKKGISANHIIVMGHHVDEGLINYFHDEEIRLYTILREPLSRIISHYNMIANNGNTDQSFKLFISRRNNFMSKFLIKKFPSLIENIFDSVHIQANSILEYFDTVFFLEDGKDFFNNFLKIFNLNYDKQLTDDRRATNFKDYARLEKLNNKNLLFLRSDFNLYNQQRDKTLNNKKNLPQVISPHYWYKVYLSNFMKNVGEPSITEHMVDALPIGFLKSLIIKFKNYEKLSPTDLFEVAMEHQNELATRENFINFQEIIDLIIKSKDEYKIDLDIKGLDSDLTKLLNLIKDESPKSLKEIKNKELLSLKYKNFDLEMACAKICYADKNYDAAKVHFHNALKLNPLLEEAFFQLHKIFKMEGKKEMAKRALEKCLELKPQNKKFKESYINLFKFNS